MGPRWYTPLMALEENGTLLAALEAEQERLRSVLANREHATLAQRPPSGKWSVVENVRHLLFAEQLHFSRFLPGGPTWSPFGLPPDGMRDQKRFQQMGNTDTASVTEVLEAWAGVHAAIRPYLDHEDERTARALERNLRHLRAHARVIERLLRDH